MFNITGGELVIILVLALIVLGPDKLPDFIRKAGRVYAEVKKMSTGFREEFRDVIDEPMREMQQTADLAKSWFDEGRSAIDELGVSTMGALTLPAAESDTPPSTRSDGAASQNDAFGAVAPTPAVDAFGTVLPAPQPEPAAEPSEPPVARTVESSTTGDEQ